MMSSLMKTRVHRSGQYLSQENICPLTAPKAQTVLGQGSCQGGVGGEQTAALENILEALIG